MAEAKVNRINLTEKDYEGAPSTMCRGCGHDAISASVMRAYFEKSIDPRKVVKLSGIGCSSKTPAYFLSQSFGFNAVHGRMSAVATGANLANHTLMPIGISGDGDTSVASARSSRFCFPLRAMVSRVCAQAAVKLRSSPPSQAIRSNLYLAAAAWAWSIARGS